MKKALSFFFLSAVLLLVSCGQNPKQTQQTQKDEQVVEEQVKKTMAEEVQPFSKTVEYGNYSFDVRVEGDSALIKPKGFQSRETMIINLQGRHLKDAQSGDLNGDGFPEIVVFTQEVGDSKLYVSGYSPNRGLSFSMFAWVPIEQHPDLKTGYKGDDEMEIIEGTLVQRFPIFDPDGKESGKIRQIQYKLEEGEALRQLKVDRVIEF